jgi:hypothetical protein
VQWLMGGIQVVKIIGGCLSHQTHLLVPEAHRRICRLALDHVDASPAELIATKQYRYTLSAALLSDDASST